MMIVARVMLGAAALLIVLGGLAWYAVAILGSTSSPRRRDDDGTHAPSIGPHAPRLSSTFAQRERRRTIGLGVAAVVGGLIIAPEAFEAVRTGVPIHVLHGPDVDGYLALAMILFVVVLGLLLIVRDRGT